MDYTNNPARNDGAGNNLHPNAHDYDQLDLIYAHLDTFSSYIKTGVSSAFSKAALGSAFANNDMASVAGGLSVVPVAPTAPTLPTIPELPELSLDVSEWGSAIGADARGRIDEFERDFGKGQKVITHVLWIQQ
jgi:hypothetical protein